MKKSAKICAPILHPEQLIDSKEVMRITGWSRKTLFNYTHTYKGRPPLLSSIKMRGRQKFRPLLVEYFLKQLEVKAVYHMRHEWPSGRGHDNPVVIKVEMRWSVIIGLLLADLCQEFRIGLTVLSQKTEVM